jgi:DNA-directed RNA polymerase specialized sigma24 family protein
MTILRTLDSIASADSDEAAFLTAATINLYTEALRRRAGRVLFTPADVKALDTILKLILNPKTDVEYKPGNRQVGPSPVEQKTILEATERAIDQLKEATL